MNIYIEWNGINIYIYIQIYIICEKKQIEYEGGYTHEPAVGHTNIHIVYVHVCIYVRTKYAFFPCTCLRIYFDMHTYKHIYIHIYTRTNIYTYTYTHVHICLCICTYTHVHTHIYMHIELFRLEGYMCIYTCTYIHIYIYMYVYTNAHAQVYIFIYTAYLIGSVICC